VAVVVVVAVAVVGRWLLVVGHWSMAVVVVAFAVAIAHVVVVAVIVAFAPLGKLDRQGPGMPSPSIDAPPLAQALARSAA
jgi:hypothetical protein